MGNEKIEALSICIPKKDSKTGKTVNMTVTDTNGNGIFDPYDSIKFSGEASCSLFSTQDFKTVNFDRSVAKDSKVTTPDLTADKDGVIKIEKDKDYNLGSVFGSMTTESKTTTTASTGTDYNVFGYNTQTQEEIESIKNITNTFIMAGGGEPAAAWGLAALMSYKPSRPTTTVTASTVQSTITTTVPASIKFADAVPTAPKGGETPKSGGTPKDGETPKGGDAPKGGGAGTPKTGEALSVLETYRKENGTSAVTSVTGTPEASSQTSSEETGDKIWAYGEKKQELTDRIAQLKKEIAEIETSLKSGVNIWDGHTLRGQLRDCNGYLDGAEIALARIPKDIDATMKKVSDAQKEIEKNRKVIDSLKGTGNESMAEKYKKTIGDKETEISGYKNLLVGLGASAKNLKDAGFTDAEIRAFGLTPPVDVKDIPLSQSKQVDAKFVKMAQDSAKTSHIQNKENEIIELLTQIGKKDPTAAQANKLTTLLQELDKIEDRSQRSKALQAALKKYENS